MNTQEENNQNFRVAFYTAEDGYLTPFASYDLTGEASNFLRSFREKKSRFSLSCVDRPSCAVKCVNDMKTIVVEDCSLELDGFFHPDQCRYLKSMVAYPIKNFGSSADHNIKACIVVDTNKTNHFKKTDLQNIETFLEQFATRLDLEYSVCRLLEAGAKSSSRGTDEKGTKKSPKRRSKGDAKSPGGKS